MKDTRLVPWSRHLGMIVLVGALTMVLVTPAGAADVSPPSGKFRFKIDTTLSWGARYRLDERDQSIIGLTNGGTAYSVNGDDGNLNFDPGIASNALKATVDFDLSGKKFGLFVRGSGFYDYELEKGDRARTQLTPDALNWVGSRAELLDAYGWWKFRAGQGAGQLRLGRQVLNWGESTFIQGGMSSLNSVDVAAIRVPGAELREAFRPAGMLWGSVDLSASLSMEAFYQFQWEKTVIDPPGTFFSTNDFAGLGGDTVFLAFGDAPDSGIPPFFADPGLDHPFLGVGRAEDRDADNGGQYGAALRWFVSGLGGTEFGFYYMNYHSRLPTINGITGTLEGALAAGPAGQRAAGRVYAILGVPPGVSPEADALAAQAGQAAATDAYAATARYFIAYPEDIKLWGLSWNSQLGTSGIAFQGEVSYHQDKPFQVDDVELLFAALSPISPGLAATNQVVPGGAGLNEEISGIRRLDAAQFQFTLTKVWGAVLGGDQAALVFEPAITHVYDMPTKDELRFEGPGTYTSGNPIHSLPGGAHAGKPFEGPEHFADPTSWGYRLAGRVVYNNAIGAVNLIPRFGWQQDVDGVSPGPGGNFIAGRKALTVGLAAQYLSRWEFDLSWTAYAGADRWNLINDRDFVGAVIKYSF